MKRLNHLKFVTSLLKGRRVICCCWSYHQKSYPIQWSFKLYLHFFSSRVKSHGLLRYKTNVPAISFSYGSLSLWLFCYLPNFYSYLFCHLNFLQHFLSFALSLHELKTYPMQAVSMRAFLVWPMCCSIHSLGDSFLSSSFSSTYKSFLLKCVVRFLFVCCRHWQVRICLKARLHW